MSSIFVDANTTIPIPSTTSKEESIMYQGAGGFRMRSVRKCQARAAQLPPEAWWPSYLANAFFQRFFGSSNFTAAGSNASGSNCPPAHRSVDSCSSWPGSAMT